MLDYVRTVRVYIKNKDMLQGYMHHGANRGKFLSELNFLCRTLRRLRNNHEEIVVVYNGQRDCAHLKLFCQVFPIVDKWHVFLESGSSSLEDLTVLSHEQNVTVYNFSMGECKAAEMLAVIGKDACVLYVEGRTHGGNWPAFMAMQNTTTINLQSRYNMFRVELSVLSVLAVARDPPTTLRGELFHVIHSGGANTQCILHGKRTTSGQKRVINDWGTVLRFAETHDMNKRSVPDYDMFLESTVISAIHPKRSRHLIYFYINALWPIEHAKRLQTMAASTTIRRSMSAR